MELCHTADGEQGVGLLLLCARHTLQGVVMCLLLVAQVQVALHLTPTEGGACQHGDLRRLPLGRVGQLRAPVEGVTNNLRPRFPLNGHILC